ncbi:hypothetical protein [Ruegeria sp. THAF33]|uniref:hypothetical protein n=1 Tax=Ruegeria sp. THAF33 TaxID=2587853 RepID=UPI00126943B2|nr:hypothetical protein [Ruegeria sp. THAF33]QFT74019.1 hypothetical protein FIU92_13355 [Ruegeria sp. THAF33]
MPRLKPKKPPRQMYLKTCNACGEEHETHKPKASRCDPCITENRRITYKSCISCGVKFPAPFGDEYNCLSCAEAHGIGQVELTPEQREALKAEETLARWKNKVATLEAALDERSNAKPKGTRKLSNKVKESAIGVAWLELCARDGQVSALSQLHERDIDEDTKLRLVMAFTRLRLKGYALDALAQLCPVHLMSLDDDKAITGLPLVETPPTPQELTEIELGLH